jgi:dolichol-phosphate mannosyltransferase
MIFFLIPVFNEALNLPLLAGNLKSSLPSQNKFYVFVDDGSVDNSSNVIEQLFQGFNFIILGDGDNHGPGFSFNLGFEWILANSVGSNDRIITMEADNTSDIGLLYRMLCISDLGYDLVLASVYAQGGGFEKTSFIRKLLSAVANLFFRFLFNVKVLTLSSFYRIYNVSIIKKIQKTYPEIIKEKGFICKLEILLKAIRCEAHIIEVPMKLHSSKRIGKSKMKIFKTSILYFNFLFRSVLSKMGRI